jgi:DNA polymerase III delta prime subunit
MSEQFGNLFIEKYRPKTLDEIVLSKEDREFFESLRGKQEIPHLLFSGAAGVGKSSTAKVIVNEILDCQYLYINTSDGGGNIDSIRGSVMGFAKTKSLDGKLKVVLLDELDSASFDSQRALRGITEDYSSTCRFIMTCNYLHKIIPALQSRCQIIQLNPPLEETVKRVVSILKKENIAIPDEQKPLLLKHIKANLPDLRRIVNDIQKYSVTGTLQIRSDVSSEFAQKVFKMICNKHDLMAIRKEIIENEKAFSNDYHNLLKQLFELVFESDLPSEKKTDCMLVISKGMELHNMIVDKEINCFTALINLHRIV